MADFFIRNSMNPHKVVRAGMTLTQYVDYSRHDGEPIWLLAVGTTEPDKHGNTIPEAYTNLITLDKLSDEVDKLVQKISEQIDWTPFEQDATPPYVDSVYPVEYVAKINEPVEFVIKEHLPSEGINVSSIKLVANGIDITNEVEIKGNPQEYHLKWRPKTIVYDTYD
jgi:hypothetical protein